MTEGNAHVAESQISKQDSTVVTHIARGKKALETTYPNGIKQIKVGFR